MKNFKKILGINFLIFLVYSILPFVSNSFSAITLCAVAIHLLALLLLGFISGFKGMSQKTGDNMGAYFITAGILFAVSFFMFFLWIGYYLPRPVDFPG